MPPRRPVGSSNGQRDDSVLPRLGSTPFKPLVIGGKTPQRIRQAVADAVARQNRSLSAKSVTIKVGDDWDGAGHRARLTLPDDLLDERPTPVPGEGVLRPMPRRRQVHFDAITDDSYAPPAWQLTGRPRVGSLQVLRRILVWFSAFLGFQLGNRIDAIRGRDSQERRAVRLRETFERIGGTFVKIGQQMASRLDLLPQRYCEELANMLDNYPPFPTEQAIAIIERSAGKKLDEIFSVFDPVPIGSASIACVYQAYLRDTGEKVAVKVRRPGIRELFEADFRALDWLGSLAETLTFMRPGFTVNIRAEFRKALTSELDFSREGRLGELFRRRASKAKERYFTAPRVYGQYTSEEVVVQEFVSGMWLGEILATLSHNDPTGLARMRELNLKPKVIARRLLFAHYWSIYSHISFHADPHPANIVVRANNELVFIDFGASGHMNNMRKMLYRNSYDSFLTGDAAAMARNAIMLTEPLPPMDINAVTKELEAAYHSHMIAVKSKQAPWYERTSASLYIASIEIMSKYNVPAPQDILMFARATLLYDTLAARLNPSINFYKEHERFAKRANRKARKKGRKALAKRLRGGLSGADYQTVGQLLSTGGDLLFRAQRLLTLPYDFAVLPFVVEKWIYTLMTLVGLALRVGVVTALGVGIVAGVQAMNQQPVLLDATLREVVGSTPYRLVILLVVVIHLRLISFRLGEKIRAE